MNIQRIFVSFTLSTCFISSALAQVEFTPSKMSACTEDIQRFCQNIKSGGGRVVQCLVDNGAKISSACKDAAVTPSDFPTPAETGVSLTITISGIRSNEGFIWVSLGDDDKIFPRGRRSVGVPAQVGSVVVTFHRLKPNKYAAVAFHDENDNGKMDTNSFGVPTEGGCFSNNVIGFPIFESAAVTVANDTNIKMSMNYFSAKE